MRYNSNPQTGNFPGKFFLSQNITSVTRQFHSKWGRASIHIPSASRLVFALFSVVALILLGCSKPGSSKGSPSLALSANQWRTAHSGSFTLKKSDTLTPGYSPVGWYDKWFSLPSLSGVERTLRKSLMPGARFEQFTLKGYLKDGEDLYLQYDVKLRFDENIYWVSTTSTTLDPKAYPKYLPLAPLLIMTPDLPAGKIYVTGTKRLLAEQGSSETFSWNIKLSSIEKEGKTLWIVLPQDVLPVQRDSAMEATILESSGNVLLARAENELGAINQTMTESFENFRQRAATISTLVSTFRTEQEKNLGAKPTRQSVKFGGSGSGEPTRTAARVGGGAAGGAAMGAMIGGNGESAGWGALAGAASGAIYDIFSKSNDKKRVEQAEDARYQAAMREYLAVKRKVDADVANYENQLIGQLQQDMNLAATQRRTELSQNKTSSKF